MRLSHIPLPSFTLVLTSGHRSLYGDPIPSIPDHLMKTVDLRYVLNDDNSAQLDDRGSSANSVSGGVDIFELESSTTSNGGVKRTVNTIKNLAFLVFLALKRRLTQLGSARV